jgi:hypothetical protein
VVKDLKDYEGGGDERSYSSYDILENSVNRERAEEAVDWAIRHLKIWPEPEELRFDDWIIVAMCFNVSDWTKGVREYNQNRKKDFEPPPGVIKNSILRMIEKLESNEISINGRPLPYKHDWEPPFPEDSHANSLANRSAYREHLEAVRGKSEGISLREWNQGKIMRFPRGGNVADCG